MTDYTRSLRLEALRGWLEEAQTAISKATMHLSEFEKEERLREIPKPPNP